MTSRGPAGEVTKLAVLGLLSMGPNHGYGLRSILEGWEAHRWLDLKYSSIYAALHRFADLGLVEVVGEGSERGPTRTTYRLTKAGRDQLRSLTRRAWVEVPKWSLPIDLAVMYLTFDWIGGGIVDRSEVETMLVERVATLDASITAVAAARSRMLEVSDLEPLRALQEAHFDHAVQLLDAELRWTQATLAALQAGKFDLT